MQVCEYDRLVKNFDEDIKYFEDYENIRKLDNRIHITHNEMIGLLKEIQEVEITIYNLKLNRNQI